MKSELECNEEGKMVMLTVVNDNGQRFNIHNFEGSLAIETADAIAMRPITSNFVVLGSVDDLVKSNVPIVTTEQGSELLKTFTQVAHSGGIHTAPEARLILFALAVGIRAKDILELGSDAGATTLALSMSGAQVTGVDNRSEYPDVKPTAEAQVAPYPNCKIVYKDALEFLRESPDNAYDLIFVDDDHKMDHVREEAIEVRRVLRAGGFVAFHDTVIHNLWQVIEEVYPDWQRINLPAISPSAGSDYGIGLVRKLQ
jgi:predicted O-methyltransferase YrrM